VLVRTPEQLREAVTDSQAARESGLILEECLIGNPQPAGPAWGDYVSVESVVLGERIVHLGVTGKPPLAAPFRETGAFFPSTLSPALRAQVEGATSTALRALGVRTGVCHTELKLTTAGPRLIEVNGRLGGYVNDIYARAAGVDLLKLAVRAALGLLDDAGPAQAERVAFQLFLAPPIWARAVRHISGMAAARALPGIQRIEVRRQDGDAVDWRGGTASAVAAVYGAAPDHAELQGLVTQLLRVLMVEYDA
jgi:hypothetical protein